MAVDIVMLNEAERRFFDDLERLIPKLLRDAQLRHDPDNGMAIIEVIPPSGDRDLSLRFWIDGEDTERNLAFGPWQTHESLFLEDTQLGSPGESFVAVVQAIVDDKIVLVEDLDEDFGDYQTALDLRQTDSLTDHLSSPFSSDHIRLHSWTGTADRELRNPAIAAVA